MVRRIRRLLRPLRYRPAEDGLRYLCGFIVARLPSYRLRRALYRAAGLKTVSGHIHKGLEIRRPDQVEIGRGTIVGFDCILDGRGGIKLGDNVNLSSEVAIWTMQHDHRDPQFGVVSRPVVVGDRAWLSFRCTVLPGVTIGEGAVVAACALVTKDVAPYTIVAGVPAAPIGERERELSYEFADARPPWFI